MPFVASRRLEDMLDEDAPDRAARRIAKDGTDRLVANTKRNTPIDTNPYRYRPGRPRGHLRASIEDGPVLPVQTPAGRGYRGTARTFDDVAPHVEWDTRPHRIEPREPGGTLHWRDRETGDHRFAKGVDHPGTSGQHMFAIGAAITEAEVEAIARPALRDFERELVPLRTGRVTGLERFAA
jgi:hypothetical protein